VGKTDNGRTIIKTTGEEPKSARRTKEHYQLWKFIEKLSLEEINVLFTKRKQELKYEKDSDRIRELRTEMLILSDAYRIIKRRKKGDSNSRNKTS
jgi:hypothetical protein